MGSSIQRRVFRQLDLLTDVGEFPVLLFHSTSVVTSWRKEEALWGTVEQPTELPGLLVCSYGIYQRQKQKETSPLHQSLKAVLKKIKGLFAYLKDYEMRWTKPQNGFVEVGFLSFVGRQSDSPPCAPQPMLLLLRLNVCIWSLKCLKASRVKMVSAHVISDSWLSATEFFKVSEQRQWWCEVVSQQGVDRVNSSPR